MSEMPRNFRVKTEEEVREILDTWDREANKYPNMTYEQGIDEALAWFVGELEDDEFTPIVDNPELRRRIIGYKGD